MRNTVHRLWHSTGFWESLIMTAATFLAGTLDYGFNVVAGRLLIPAQYSVLVASISILQILLHVTNVIRNVVAFYMADLRSKAADSAHLAHFFQRSHRWAWRWGIVAAVLLFALSWPIAAVLNFASPAPLWAASLALVMLFVRPITDGTLQGLQRFYQLATVNVTQAVVRLVAAVLLIQWGWQAVGGVLALPIATFSAFGLALYFLRGYAFAPPTAEAPPLQVSLRYSATTFVGLLLFALLTNSDVMITRAIFSEPEAATYAAVITLGKINLFISLAIGMVFFPKAIERHNAGRPVRPLLAAAFAAALLPGLALTVLYFLFPAEIVQLVFRNEFANPGLVLGLIGMATTLFAGVNLWLNYALSTGRTAYLVGLGVALLVLWGGIALFHDSLVQVGWTMVAAGLIGNIAGVWASWERGGSG